MIPVILSGGSGSRLWPLSRALRPKQFLGLTADQTLFQLTLARLTGLVDGLTPIVVANDDHRFLVADQCLQMGAKPKALILEPLARNTAPAIAVAALAAREFGDTQSASKDSAGANSVGRVDSKDPVLLVLPSDHVFQNLAAFEAAVRTGEAAATQGAMVTFGIVPTHPETGYGYVKARSTGKSISSAMPVEAFVEKPDLDNAKAYLAK